MCVKSARVLCMLERVSVRACERERVFVFAFRHVIREGGKVREV